MFCLLDVFLGASAPFFMANTRRKFWYRAFCSTGLSFGLSRYFAPIPFAVNKNAPDQRGHWTNLNLYENTIEIVPYKNILFLKRFSNLFLLLESPQPLPRNRINQK